MFNFISNFVTTLAIALVLAALMIAGLFIGKRMKDKKLAKQAEEAQASGMTEEK